MRGLIPVTPGQVLRVMVGGAGESVMWTGGGGGRSFVWDNATSTLYMAAGGGGGAAYTSNGYPGLTSNNGTNGVGVSNGAGIGGNAGTVPTCCSIYGMAAGGAGWFTNGSYGTVTLGCGPLTYPTGGTRPLLGGAGGTRHGSL